MLNLEKLYYKTDTRTEIYFTILDDKIYFQDCALNLSYVYYKGEKKRILKYSCATHNFTPFKMNGKYYAIGGMDDWKKDSKWRGLTFKQFKGVFQDHFKKPYIRDQEFYDDKVAPHFLVTPIWKHNKGLYLFQSEAGLGWKEVYQEPILTVNNKGFINSLAWKSAEFDARPDVVYFKGLYYIYMRANVARGVRRVQFTTTKDFKEFSEFQLIETYSRDNDYFFSGFTYNNMIYAFIPSYDMQKSYIDFFSSTDGKDFRFLNRYFEGLPYINEEGRPKNKIHSCSGFKEDKTKIYAYFHYNYMGYEQNHDVNVMEYSLNKGDL